METIIERNENNKVIVGDQSFYIPQDRIALSILVTNKIVDKAVYSEDGWVYVEDKRVKKWFTNVYAEGGGNPVKIWHPILKDARALEARWWKMMCKRRKFASEVWSPAYDAIMESGEAHTKITHEHSGELDWWWYKKVEKHGLSLDWVKEPKNPINLDIGQHYYEMDRKLIRYGSYTWKFNIALAKAIYDELLSKNPPNTSGSVWCITMNGRNFIYLSNQVGAGQPFWQSISWPDTADTMKVTVLE